MKEWLEIGGLIFAGLGLVWLFILLLQHSARKREQKQKKTGSALFEALEDKDKQRKD